LRYLTIVVAALAAFFCCTFAVLADERIGDFIFVPDLPDVIILDGEISSGTTADFHRALAKHPGVKVVVLHSGGGYVDPALQLAAEIRPRGLATAIPSGFTCYSACTYLFFAGRTHVVRGKLGVHALSEDGAWNGSGGVYDGDVKAALRGWGASAGVIKAMVSTPASGLHVFSAKEISSLAINRGGGLAAHYASYLDIRDFVR